MLQKNSCIKTYKCWTNNIYLEHGILDVKNLMSELHYGKKKLIHINIFVLQITTTMNVELYNHGV